MQRKERIWCLTAVFGLLTAGVAWADGIVNPETISSVGALPLPIACLALVGLSIYLMHRTSREANETAQNVAAALQQMMRELHERPCIRSPKND